MKFFDHAKTMVMQFLGIESFTKVKGKAVVTEDQRNKLVEEYGEKFAEKFEADLAASQDKPGSDPVLERLDARIAAYEANQKKLEKANADLTAQVDKLANAGEPEPQAEIVKNEKGGRMLQFKPNMNYRHNKVASAVLEQGPAALEIFAGSTIDQNVVDEFGAMVDYVKPEMIRDIITGFDTAQFLNWKRAIHSWKATKAEITRVIQQFTSTWTPLGKATFTPLEIPLYRFKINYPIKPAELEDWILEMYDESKSIEQMPVTLYIINNLLIPKAKEDLNDICAIAEYVEITEEQTAGDAGQDPFSAMNGFVTQLKTEKATGTSSINFLLNDVTLTKENIVEKMEAFADDINIYYRKKKMPVYADPDVVLMYNRAYTTKYPLSKNADGTMTRIDHTKLNLVPLDSMIGTGAFFATPPENFIGLRHKNEPGATKLEMQKVDYDLKVFAEFRFGVGFAIAEAVFAYLPPVEASGSGSGA